MNGRHLRVVGANDDGTVGAPPDRSVWDSAREVLAHYEKEYAGQRVPRIFLVIDAPNLTVGHAGDKCRPTDAAGLLMGGAQMFLAAGVTDITTDPSAPTA